MNSATDNPLVFFDPQNDDNFELISGGNFHGQYPGMACDKLVLCNQNLFAIVERLINRAVDGSLSVNLPCFLISQSKAGLNSGLMIAQYTVAALTSENKNRCFPSTADSIPTCENQEDHVSMGAHASRKVLESVEDLRNTLGILLFVAAQAWEFLPPHQKIGPLLPIYELVRSKIRAWDEDRFVDDGFIIAQQIVHQIGSLSYKETLKEVANLFSH
jgi:histidine ammonia-lyase